MLNIFLVVLSCIGWSFHIQAHGFNDLDYARNLVRKGVRYFKFDVAPAAYQSCMYYSSWKPTNNKCQYLGLPQHTCCLAMRGDTSGIPFFNQPFNTSQDFVNLLISEKEHFKSGSFIAINFQYSAPLANMTRQFWLSLIRSVRDNNIDVTIATGSDGFILEYDRVCKEGNCSVQEQQISDFNIILQSNSKDPEDERNYKKRYRNFNVNFNMITKFCKQGFPDWLDIYHQYPLIFWEPSSQEAIQFVIDSFKSDSCKRPTYYNSIDNLTIATNLDPEMVTLYSQIIQGHHHVLKQACNQTMILSFVKSNQVITGCPGDKPKLLFLESNEIVQQFDISVLSLKCSKQQCLSLEKNYSLMLRSLPTLSYKQMIEKHYNKHPFAISELGYATILEERVTDSLILTLADFNGKSSHHRIKEIPIDIALINHQKAVYLSQSNSQIWVHVLVQDRFQKKSLQYGQNARMTNHNDKFGIAFDHGLCQSAVYFNNNDLNKCNFFYYPHFTALYNVSSLINMLRISYQELQDFVVNPTRSDINACSMNVDYSKVAVGSNPLLALGQENELILGYQTLNYFNIDLMSSLFCGSPNKQEKIESRIVRLSRINL